MKKTFVLMVIFSFLAFLSGYIFRNTISKIKIIEPTPKPRPLEVYTIENLSKTSFKEGEIVIGSELTRNNDFTTYLVSFSFNPNPTLNERKKTSGYINIPNSQSDNKYPLIVMLRGYVDQTIYKTGIGTQKAADFFAKNGFITIAPDFLGYAGSDKEAGNIFETRFQTYTSVLNLLSSLGSVEKWNQEDLFLWGHSNGGQVALTVLEITGKALPTVLWAPVSKPFPYSILYYTDESEDKGKLIRRELSLFEQDYDVEQFSLDNYLGNIKAPIQIHQGTADDAIPLEWTKSLNKKLNENITQSQLYIYPGADHNLKPSWDTVVARDLEFFRKFMQN